MRNEGRALFLLIIIHLVSSISFNDPCSKTIEADSASGLLDFADHLRSSVDYKIDPCEDFYRFACGKWIDSTPETETSYGSISRRSQLSSVYEEKRRELLASRESSTSRAITEARNLYHSCITTGQEWEAKGTSGINYVMKIIREFGVFPMLSEEEFDAAQFNAKFDLTRLLAYFNRNATVVPSIVPRIMTGNDLLSQIISFIPPWDVVLSLWAANSRKYQRIYSDFLVRLMRSIAADIGVNYSRTNAPPDILDTWIFIKKLGSLETPPAIKFNVLMNSDYFNETMKLSELDGIVDKVNWTEYLLLVAPSAAHGYVLNDPLVAIMGREYMEQLNQLLNETSPRIITNYVMVQYIVSWLPRLEKKYSELLDEFRLKTSVQTPFSSSTDEPVLSRNRSEMCFQLTEMYYEIPILSLYARSRSTEVLRSMVEEMVVEIKKGLEEEISESNWMEAEFKRVAIGKLDHLASEVLDDDLFHNDTALDEQFSAHHAITNLTFIDMVNEVARTQKENELMGLMAAITPDQKYKFNNFGFVVNAFYAPLANKIMIPLPFLDFPVFDENFPRSFLYGSVGFVIGHEISHSLDTTGRLFDAMGIQRDWWKKEWVKSFNEKAKCFVEQYGNIKIPKFNVSLGGKRTLPENIADNVGIKIAYRAYKKHLAKHNDSEKMDRVDGFTPDQMFFLGYGKFWCTKTADFTVYEQRKRKHSPSEYRVNPVTQNTPAFADAFHCSPKSKMNPKKRCSLW